MFNLKSLSKRKDIFILALVVSTVSLSNFGIYWTYQSNFLLGEILVIETVLFFLLNFYTNRIILLALTFIILFALSVFLLTRNLDSSILSVSTQDSIIINERHEFYGNELGKVYKNRFGLFYFKNLRLYFSKISDNFFSSLDLSFYFSPRTLAEYGKYPLFFSPLFILGVLFLIKDVKKPVIIYLVISLLINSFIKIDSKVGPILLYPFISLCIALGAITVIKKLKNFIHTKI